MKEYTEDEIIETLNGCICCGVRKDLSRTLEAIAERTRRSEGKTLKLDAVVIETTGLADPSPITQTFFVDRAVRESYRLDGIVAVVDAKHVEQHLEEERTDGAINETVQQLAFADRILLNKVDLVPDEADLARIESRIRTINTFAPLKRMQHGRCAIDTILGIRAFDLRRVLQENPAFLVPAFGNSAKGAHEKTISSHAINVSESVDLQEVLKWINRVLDRQGLHIYRMKGILAIDGCDEKYVYHGVHQVFQGSFSEHWGIEEERSCKLVFIGKNLNKGALEASFLDCLATEEHKARRAAKLRFRIGTVVECMTGGQWARGTVVGYWYHPMDLQAGMFDPYEIRLDNGIITSIGVDDNRIIRLPKSSSGGRGTSGEAPLHDGYYDEDDSDDDLPELCDPSSDLQEENGDDEEDSDDDLPELCDPDNDSAVLSQERESCSEKGSAEKAGSEEGGGS